MAETSAQAVGRLSVVLGIGLGVLVSSIAAAEACGAYFARNVSTTVGTAGAKLFNQSFGVPRLRGRESRARKKTPSAAKPP
jgi:hypothetical protein